MRALNRIRAERREVQVCVIDSDLKRFHIHGVWVSETLCKGPRRLRAIGLAGGKAQHKDMGNEAENYFMKKGEQEG